MTISFFHLSSKLKQKKSLEHNQKSDKTRVSMNNKDSKTLISHYLPVNLNSGAQMIKQNPAHKIVKDACLTIQLFPFLF